MLTALFFITVHHQPTVPTAIRALIEWHVLLVSTAATHLARIAFVYKGRVKPCALALRELLSLASRVDTLEHLCYTVLDVLHTDNRSVFRWVPREAPLGKSAERGARVPSNTIESRSHSPVVDATTSRAWKRPTQVYGPAKLLTLVVGYFTWMSSFPAS